MKFGICNEIFQGWTLEDSMAFVARTGYDALEIAPFTIRRYVTDVGSAERRAIGDEARKQGLAISGIHWVLAQTEGLHVTHPDAAVREATSRYLSALVDFCADIGGQYMVVGSPKQRAVLPGVGLEQARVWAQEAFAGPVRHAASRNVVICLEPLAPSETNFINTAAEAVSLVAPFESPNFKIILDVKAMSSEAKPIPQIIQETASWLGYFHANDKNLKGPGFGNVDFEPIGAALKAVGYEGYVSVEVFDFEEGPEAIARGSLECLKRFFR